MNDREVDPLRDQAGAMTDSQLTARETDDLVPDVNPNENPDVDRDVAFILVHFDTDILVRAWRNRGDEALYTELSRSRAVQVFARTLTIAASAAAGVHVLFLLIADSSTPTWWRLVVLAGAIVNTISAFHLTAQIRTRDTAMAACAPFATTQAGRFAYREALRDPRTRDAAEACRVQLAGLSAAQQVRHPAHAKLLRLAAQAVADS